MPPIKEKTYFGLFKENLDKAVGFGLLALGLIDAVYLLASPSTFETKIVPGLLGLVGILVGAKMAIPKDHSLPPV